MVRFATVLALLLSVCASVQAFPSGAGSCTAGNTAVGGPHVSVTMITTGALSQVGLEVRIDGVALDPSTPTDFTVNEDHTIELMSTDSAQPFRGFLLRLGSDGSIDTTEALSGDDSGSDIQLSPLCTDAAGLTHTSNSDKTSIMGTLRVDEAADGLTLDVTVVAELRDDVNLSEYYYSGFTLNAVTATVTTTAPTAVPVAEPVAEPVAAPVDAPVAAPVAAPTSPPVATPTPVDAPVDAPTPPPAAAPVDAAPTEATNPAAAPVDAPVAAPVDAPTSPPVAAPVSSPDASPTQATFPAAAPVDGPVSSPNAAPTVDTSPAAAPIDAPAASPVDSPSYQLPVTSVGTISYKRPGKDCTKNSRDSPRRDHPRGQNIFETSGGNADRPPRKQNWQTQWLRGGERDNDGKGYKMRNSRKTI